MKHLSLIKTSTFALAIAAMIALSSNEAQAQFSIHGAHGGGIDVGRNGVNIHSGGNHYGGSRYSNYGSNYGASQYRGNHGIGSGYGSSRSYGYGGSYGSGGSYGVQRAPAHSWHDTSHYDYHPPQAVRHGNHYDVQPGHYDRHQTGHVDHNHR